MLFGPVSLSLAAILCRSLHSARIQGEFIYNKLEGLVRLTGRKVSWPSNPSVVMWRVRLEAQDTALSRRRSRVRIPYALPNLGTKKALGTIQGPFLLNLSPVKIMPKGTSSVFGHL